MTLKELKLIQNALKTLLIERFGTENVKKSSDFLIFILNPQKHLPRKNFI